MTTALSISFFLGLAGAWFMARYAYRIGLLDVPNDRSSHTLPTPRGGGVGIMLAFTCSTVLLGVPFGIVVPAALLALASFFDDRLNLSARTRLIIQFLAAFSVLSIKFQAPYSTLIILLLSVWAVFIVGTANFYNFMDGINGIAGITGVVGFSLVACYALLLENSQLAAAAFCVAAACLGFLPLNMPKARVFMGDVGSILLGFTFAVFVALLTGNTSDFLVLASFLCTFYADALSTLFIRWRDGERLSQAHRRHLYQILVNELGFPHWKISLLYGTMQLLVGVAMLCAHDAGMPVQSGLLLIFTTMYCIMTWCVRHAAAGLKERGSGKAALES